MYGYIYNACAGALNGADLPGMEGEAQAADGTDDQPAVPPVVDDGWQLPGIDFNAEPEAAEARRTRLCVCGCGRQVCGRKGSALWYHEHQHDPVLSGSSVTLAMLQFFMLLWKERYNVCREGADSLLKFLSKLVGHQPNILPPSWHLFQASASEDGKVQSWRQYERHACFRKGCKGHVWKHLPPQKYSDAANIPEAEGGGDKCPHCQGPRFKTVYQAGELV